MLWQFTQIASFVTLIESLHVGERQYKVRQFEQVYPRSMISFQPAQETLKSSSSWNSRLNHFRVWLSIDYFYTPAIRSLTHEIVVHKQAVD